MSKETILKTALQPKLLHFLDNYDNFDMEDYKLLVQNKVKNAICFIYLIKFKYGLLPDKSLLTNKTVKIWAEEIINFIKLDINELYDILVNTMDSNNKLAYTDYPLSDVIKKTDGKLTDDSLIKLLATQGYYDCTRVVLDKYDGYVTNELFQIIKSVISIYGTYKIKFDNIDTLKEYVMSRKDINDDDIKLNQHLFDTPDKYTELFANMKDIRNYLTTKCFNKLVKPPMELVRNVQFCDDPKLFKYYDKYSELYKTVEIKDTHHIKYSNDVEKDLKTIQKYIETCNYYGNSKINHTITIKLYLIKQIYNGQKERIKTFLEEMVKINNPKFVTEKNTIYNDLQEYLKDPKKSKKLMK